MRLSQAITRSAQLDPDVTATRFAGRTRTFAASGERIARLGAALDGLGVQPARGSDPGTRVAYLGLNSDRYLEYFFAVSWAGGVFVPINVRLAPPEFVHWLTDSDATILFVDDTFAPLAGQLRDACPQLEHVVYAGESETPPDGLLAFEQLVADADPIEPRDRGDDELAGLFYTGGTTGRSKGVMLSHRNLLANALHSIPAFGFRRGDVYLHSAPMFHLANGAGMLAAALAGAGHAMIDRFTPEGFCVAVAEHGVSSAILVPTMVAMLVDDPACERYDLSSLRLLGYGGSPMSEAVIKRTREALPTTALMQAFGQTEAAPVMTTLSDERHVFDGPLAGKTRSAGDPVIGVEVAVLDEQGNVLPRGETGEICGRGDNVMQGYWKLPELTAETLRGGWLHTGDMGYMDEEGFVFVVDRLKDMIVSGGENVYTAEVENALYAHDAVAECAVIGVPDDRWGERVHAIVTLREGHSATPDELIAHCHGVIANYKCPRSLELHDEALPRSGAGKILKTELRKPYWEGRERQIGDAA